MHVRTYTSLYIIRARERAVHPLNPFKLLTNCPRQTAKIDVRNFKRLSAYISRIFLSSFSLPFSSSSMKLVVTLVPIWVIIIISDAYNSSSFPLLCCVPVMKRWFFMKLVFSFFFSLHNISILNRCRGENEKIQNTK